MLFDGGLRLWADPDVRDAPAATDFWITDFRSDPASVFLCVSQKDLGVLSPLIRLMFQQMFTLLQETDRTVDDKFDVLFLLDEFASLGKMEEMGRAITTVRSSGAHLMLIVQSLANLREIYGADGAANFMGNCELQLFMAPTDVDTPRYISEAIGDQTRMARIKSWRQRGFDAASIQERQEGMRLIRPEQIRMLGPGAAIALVRDQNPVRVAKVRYYEDRALIAHSGRRAAGTPPNPPEVMPEVSVLSIPLGHAQSSGDSVAGTPDAGASADPCAADQKAHSEPSEKLPTGSSGRSRGSSSGSPGFLVVVADGPGRQSELEVTQLRGILGGQGGFKERVQTYRRDERTSSP